VNGNRSTGRGRSRRAFLKTTAAAGGAVAANLSLLSNVHAGGKDEIKVGLIGCGKRGTGAAFDVLHAAPNVKFVAPGDALPLPPFSCRAKLQVLRPCRGGCKRRDLIPRVSPVATARRPYRGSRQLRIERDLHLGSPTPHGVRALSPGQRPG